MLPSTHVDCRNVKLFIEFIFCPYLECVFFFFGRHLDNLLLRNDGGLFHVDFGFILGRDPKPFPPPMKLCKEMVEAMGGAERYSSHWMIHFRFKSGCAICSLNCEIVNKTK